MTTNPSVSMWVTVDDGCRITSEVNGSAGAEFILGRNAAEGIGLSVQSEALRTFLEIGGLALEEMDALFAREQAEVQHGSMTG